MAFYPSAAPSGGLDVFLNYLGSQKDRALRKQAQEDSLKTAELARQGMQSELDAKNLALGRAKNILNAQKQLPNLTMTLDELGGLPSEPRLTGFGETVSVPAPAEFPDLRKQFADQPDKVKVAAGRMFPDMTILDLAEAWNSVSGALTGAVPTVPGMMLTGVSGPVPGPGGRTATYGPGFTQQDREAFGLSGSVPVTRPVLKAVDRVPPPAPFNYHSSEPVVAPVVQPRPTAQAVPASRPAQTLGTLPDVDVSRLSPYALGRLQDMAKTQSDIAGIQTAQANAEKAQVEADHGDAEQRKAHRELAINAAQLSHRLDEYRDVVAEHGNYPFRLWSGKGTAKLSSLPLDIADNWTKITNPGGVLREGLVHLGKTEQIPAGFFTTRATTRDAIQQTKNVLAGYIRSYENLETTKDPVEGLTAEVRGLVGPTKFGAVRTEETPGTLEAEKAEIFAERLAGKLTEAQAVEALLKIKGRQRLRDVP